MCITYEMGYIYFYYVDYIRSCNKNTSNIQKKLCKYPKIPQIIRGAFFKKNFKSGRSITVYKQKEKNRKNLLR